MRKHAKWINNTHPKQWLILIIYQLVFFLICFMFDVMYWNYHYVKYLVLLVTLLGFIYVFWTNIVLSWVFLLFCLIHVYEYIGFEL